MKTKEFERLFKALANSRRLTILALLKKKSNANVGTIAEIINVSFRATSRHLLVLASANLVERKQQGLEMHYSLSSDLPQEAKTIISQI